MATYIELLKAKRERIKVEIEQIEKRLAISHELGDSSSAQGISANFSENLKWRARLDTLYGQLERLDEQIDGTPSLNGSPFNVAVVRRNLI